MTLVVLVLVVCIVAWIAPWDLRRPDAVEARAHHPFARPRMPARRMALLIAGAVALCLISLAVLPLLDGLRFP